MKCKKCGTELPEGAKFCGVCGTPVDAEPETATAEEINAEPETAPVEEINTAPASVTEEAAPAEEKTEAVTTEETASEETAPEVIEPEAEEVKTEPEETKDSSIGSEIGNSLKETAAGKVLLGDDGKFDKQDISRMGTAAKEGVTNAYKSVPWSEFKTFLDIFKDPFGDHALGMLPSFIVMIAALLVNWWVFTSFMDALIITMVIYAGYFLVLYIDREEKSFDGKKAFGRAAQMLTIPVIAMFVMCIFTISMKSSLNNTSTLYTGINSYLYSLRSSLVIVMIFMLFSLVTYIMGMIEIGKKMNKYLLAVIITAVFSISLFYLLTQGLNAMMSIL